MRQNGVRPPPRFPRIEPDCCPEMTARSVSLSETERRYSSDGVIVRPRMRVLSEIGRVVRDHPLCRTKSTLQVVLIRAAVECVLHINQHGHCRGDATVRLVDAAQRPKAEVGVLRIVQRVVVPSDELEAALDASRTLPA